MSKKQKAQQKQNPPADRPVYPPLCERMTVDFLFNDEGKVWLLHDRPLPAKLAWAEYDADLEKITLITETGKLQDMGLEVPAGFGHHLHAAMEITTLLVEETGVTDYAVVPIISRHTVN